MEARLFNRFRGLPVKKGLLVLIISSLMGASGVIALSKNNQSKPKDIDPGSTLIQKSETLKNAPTQELMPMPSGQLDLALAKVKSTRDPFQEAPVTESSNIDLLRSAIQFNGIAKSGDTLVAIIKTEEGQNFYKVGDKLDNGFIIEKISGTNVTADISNGVKTYRLSIENFRNR